MVLADIAGGRWPDLARQAALALSADAAQESNPSASLLLDVWLQFTEASQDRMASRTLVAKLSSMEDRPWRELLGAKPLTERWLARQLALYGIRPKPMLIGDSLARGYLLQEIEPAFRRYAPKAELDALLETARLAETKPAPSSPPTPPPHPLDRPSAHFSRLFRHTLLTHCPLCR